MLPSSVQAPLAALTILLGAMALGAAGGAAKAGAASRAAIALNVKIFSIELPPEIAACAYLVSGLTASQTFGKSLHRKRKRARRMAFTIGAVRPKEDAPAMQRAARGPRS